VPTPKRLSARRRKRREINITLRSLLEKVLHHDIRPHSARVTHTCKCGPLPTCVRRAEGFRSSSFGTQPGASSSAHVDAPTSHLRWCEPRPGSCTVINVVHMATYRGPDIEIEGESLSAECYVVRDVPADHVIVFTSLRDRCLLLSGQTWCHWHSL